MLSPDAMRSRLDNALVQRGLVASRSRAADLIKRGVVRVDGCVVTKAGEQVAAGAVLELPSELAEQVSRSAGKLQAGLRAFGFSAAGRIALDVGASTGGFTQILLDHGARKVFAVDVGHGQLDARLRSDPRIVDLQGVDARSLDRERVPASISAIVADVSFISLTLVLPAALALAAQGCWLVALVKPQFELGRAAIGKRGVVREDQGSARAAEPIAALLSARGWHLRPLVPSPLPGKEGNREWLIGASLDA